GDGATICSWETRGLKKSRTYLPADFLSIRDGGRRYGDPECLFGGQESAYSVRYHMADLQPRVEQHARYEYLPHVPLAVLPDRYRRETQFVSRVERPPSKVHRQSTEIRNHPYHDVELHHEMLDSRSFHGRRSYGVIPCVRGRQDCRSGPRRVRRWFRMEAGGG